MIAEKTGCAADTPTGECTGKSAGECELDGCYTTASTVCGNCKVPYKNNEAKRACVKDTNNASCDKDMAQQCGEDKCWSAHTGVCGDCKFPYVGLGKNEQSGTGCEAGQHTAECKGEAAKEVCEAKSCYNKEATMCGNCKVTFAENVSKKSGCEDDTKRVPCLGEATDECGEDMCYGSHPNVCESCKVEYQSDLSKSTGCAKDTVNSECIFKNKDTELRCKPKGCFTHHPSICSPGNCTVGYWNAKDPSSANGGCDEDSLGECDGESIAFTRCVKDKCYMHNRNYCDECKHPWVSERIITDQNGGCIKATPIKPTGEGEGETSVL